MVSLNQYLDMDGMREAYRLTRKSGAPGVDGITAAEYERNLDANLADLLERAKSGQYQAPPVRRAYIPKGQHEKRPLGIPTLEDKILQRAVVMRLQPVYEQDFLDCSHGFRPHRSPHTTLDALWKRIMGMGGCWLINFHPPQRQDGQRTSFDFVGFTHYWDVSRKGRDFVRRTTRRERFTRALQNVRESCRKTMAEPIQEQWKGLCVRMRGHYGFYGITGNARALSRSRPQGWFTLYMLSKTVTRGTGCRKPARPGLWGGLGRKAQPYPEPTSGLPFARFHV